MRLPTSKRPIRWLAGIAAVALVLLPGVANAQLPAVTPNTSVTPERVTAGWVYQMALGAVALGVLVVLVFLFSYLRFAPKFFGREEAPKAPPPGVRPPLLSRQGPARQPAPAPAARAPAPAPTPAPAQAPAAAPSGAATATATAVAERPAPAAAPEPTPEPAVAASATTTAAPSAEPAVQADAVGQAEAAEPEASPTAMSVEEVGQSGDEAPPAEAPPAEAPPAEGPVAEEAAPQPSQSHAGPAGLDQETFDRVLQEQLDKGVDRRVAEGRARAAAVVAARKKTQG